MATFLPKAQSGGDADGNYIPITNTASPGNVIHTFTLTATDRSQKLILWGDSMDGASHDVRIEFVSLSTREIRREVTALGGGPLWQGQIGFLGAGSFIIRVYCPGGANLTQFRADVVEADETP